MRVILDLITLKFLGSYGTKPLYAFGIPGLVSLLLGGSIALPLVGRKLTSPMNFRIHRSPLLPISLLGISFGLQSLMTGLLAELLMRTYHESQNKPTYVVRTVTTTLPRVETYATVSSTVGTMN